jgi:hypothetical protein
VKKKLKATLRHGSDERGFALPLVLGMGLMMLMSGALLITLSQNNSTIASGRVRTGNSFAVAEGGVARTLAQLTKPDNAVLLARDYDPINPKTGKTYLGPDGILNNGDEETTAVDEWTGYDPSKQPCFQLKGWTAPSLALRGSIGDDTYTIRAYRYDKTQQLGILLVEGSDSNNQSAGAISVTFPVNPVLDDFPGIILINPTSDDLWPAGVLGLRGREILGSKGNVYYIPYSSADSSLTASSAPGDANRPSYLNAIFSSDLQDGGNGDTVAGKIFACRLKPYIPPNIQGTDLGVVTTSQTLVGTGGSIPTLFQAQKIDLANNDTVTVDTTNGPVYIYMKWPGTPTLAINLRNTAKILNIRTDGKPPRVGDLRIMAWGDSIVTLYDRTCIQNAFLWSNRDRLNLFTSGPGCPGGQNTNFEGVAWMEAILSSKNAASDRNINYLGGMGQPPDTTIIPGATSGIAVPNDVTSLVDLLEYVDWPVRYKMGSVKNWNRQQL